ncbi:UDP-N-acetylglucosamine transferase subunit ALG14 [Vanrija pseudolonga]|uniref:UDP-N-acetylglucosamine transferase subunit ALG14 n=1 Tax=Vanrija pseudolonga TaxID=143232 RepID=A0AAF1BIW8_9TREE|nr:UDP-N-acetylglucosamine transferase subunit ALG14 [Vanrija pseudolonga]
MLLLLAAVLAAAILALGLRLRAVLPRGAPPPRRTAPARLGVFLGSGGHTGEMRALLSALDGEKYAPRVYVYGAGDEMSLRAVADVESALGGTTSNKDYELLALPRARAVGEGKLSTLVSASKTLVFATWYTFALPLLRRPSTPWVDVLLLNGPGTAVVLVAVAYIRRLLGLSYTRIIYVESFARVKTLSLSGKLLRPFVDTFVVQWPEAVGPSATKAGADADTAGADSRTRPSRVTYRGFLV